MRGKRPWTVPVVVLVGLGLVGIVVTAAPLGVAVDAPEAVEPNQEFDLTYVITNEGDEATSALGVHLSSVPEEVRVERIESDDGSIAPNQHAVFWIQPVAPGDTVEATITLVVDADRGTEVALEADIASDEYSTVETTRLAVASPPGDGGDDDGASADDGSSTTGDDAGTPADETDDGAPTDDEGDGSSPIDGDDEERFGGDRPPSDEGDGPFGDIPVSPAVGGAVVVLVLGALVVWRVVGG